MGDVHCPFCKHLGWTTLTSDTTELAPISGPLLEAIDHTAQAIDHADRSNRSLEVRTRCPEADMGEEGS